MISYLLNAKKPHQSSLPVSLSFLSCNYRRLFIRRRGHSWRSLRDGPLAAIMPVNRRSEASQRSDEALVKSQLQGKYHQRNQIYKQITAQDVILVDQRGLSSPYLNNAILPWPVGIGGRPFEI